MINALVLCAGKGERLKPVTEKLAKPAVPFLNAPLCHYSLYWLKKAGINSVYCNTFYLPKTIGAALLEFRENNPKITLNICHDGSEILGSGGGLKNLESELKNSTSILLMNGDEVFFPDQEDFLMQTIEQHTRNNNLATLITTPLKGVGDTVSGVWAKNSQVYGFGKKGNIKGPDRLPEGCRAHHYTGYMVLSPRIFNYLSAGFSNIIYDGLIAGLEQGENVEQLSFAGLWVETGNVDGFLTASGEVLAAYNQGNRVVKQALEELWGGAYRVKQGQDYLALLPKKAVSHNEPEITDFAVVHKNALGWQLFKKLERAVVIQTPDDINEAAAKSTIIL